MPACHAGGRCLGPCTPSSSARTSSAHATNLSCYIYRCWCSGSFAREGFCPCFVLPSTAVWSSMQQSISFICIVGITFLPRQAVLWSPCAFWRLVVGTGKLGANEQIGQRCFSQSIPWRISPYHAMLQFSACCQVLEILSDEPQKKIGRNFTAFNCSGNMC